MDRKEKGDDVVPVAEARVLFFSSSVAWPDVLPFVFSWQIQAKQKEK